MRSVFVWMLYKAWELLYDLWSHKRTWLDEPTRALRFLIAAALPLAFVVHFALEGHRVGGWGRLIDLTITNFRKAYEVGDLSFTIFAYVFVGCWFGAAFLLLVMEQLTFKTRGGLTVILGTAVGMIVAYVVVYLSANSGIRGGELWFSPLFIFLPMVVVGLLIARLVERISEPKRGAEGE